jgi:hypothetical protein
MGGGQGQTNELLLDGTPDMTRNRRDAYNPPVDAVSEIKVEAFQLYVALEPSRFNDEPIGSGSKKGQACTLRLHSFLFQTVRRFHSRSQ